MKTNYHSASIQRVYKESGLQRLEEAINVILSSERWNEDLRQNCLEKLIQNLRRTIGMDCLEEKYADHVQMCSSVRQFLGGLDSSSESKRAADFIATACAYNGLLSSRKLANIIGSGRWRLDQLKRNVIIPYNSGFGKKDDVDRVDTSIVEKETIMDANVLEEEPLTSEDESLHGGSTSDEDDQENVIEVDNDGNSLPEAVILAPALPVLNDLCVFISKKKQRSDKVDLTFVRKYWHYDTVTQYDTNSSRSYLCYDPEAKTTCYHRQRMQHTRTRDMHKEFLQSEVYLRHLDCFPGQNYRLDSI